MKKRVMCLLFCVCMVLTTGCWDRTELNDLAIELGWGLDEAENGNVEVSAQVIVPGSIASGQNKGGGKGQSSFVETGTGKDTLDAVQKMQTKLPRTVFRGHRRVIVIGESLARHGLSGLLDTFTRDPQVRLRADVLVVKGGTAKEFLETTYPLESFPALGAVKEHRQVGGSGDKSFLQFLTAATSDDSSPILPSVEIVTDESASQDSLDTGQDQALTKGFQMAGAAVFNRDMKMVGFINMDEKRAMNWIDGIQKVQTFTVYVPQGGGTVSLDVTKMGRKVQPTFQGNRLKFNITLTGQGIIRENNTNLDLTQSRNLNVVQSAFDQKTEKFVLQTVRKVQSKYDTDIFGLGETIHKKYPNKWKVLKKSWDKEFPRADVAVRVHLTVQRIGLTGPSLQLKQNEIEK